MSCCWNTSIIHTLPIGVKPVIEHNCFAPLNTAVVGGVKVLVIWYPICVDVNVDIVVDGNVAELEVGNPLIQDALILLAGKETVPPETVKPFENVCKADHVFCAAREIKPLIAEALILLFGNIIVPPETVKPPVNVCLPVHVLNASFRLYLNVVKLFNWLLNSTIADMGKELSGIFIVPDSTL